MGRLISFHVRTLHFKKANTLPEKWTYRAGMGPGWGGPAKGASTASGNMQWSRGMRHLESATDTEKAFREANRLRRAALRERMMNVLETIAETSDSDMARLSAADKVLDRLDGKPKQTVASTVSGPDGEPVQVQAIRRVIVDPTGLLVQSHDGDDE